MYFPAEQLGRARSDAPKPVSVAIGGHYGYVQFPWVKALHMFRYYSTRIVIAFGILGVIGLAFGPPDALVLTKNGPGVYPFSWLAIMMIAIALAMHRMLRRPRNAKRALLAGAALISILGLLAAADVTWAVRFSTAVSKLAHHGNSPSIMNVEAAMTCLFLAVGVLFHRAIPLGALLMLAISMIFPVLSLSAYLYATATLSGAMSFPSTVGLLLLNISAFSVIAHKRVMRTVLSDGTLGRLVRFQLLMGIIIPFAAGYWFFVGDREINHTQDVAYMTVVVWLYSALMLVVMNEHERTDFARRVLERKLLEMSMNDPLTGVASRRGAAFMTEQLLRGTRNKDETVSILVMDLDRFKLVNDKYGHGVGDEILCRATELIKARLRSTDYLARWGGEEFVAVLPRTPIESAQRVAQDLVRILERDLATGILPAGKVVTVSVGCAALFPMEHGIDAAVARADSALYEAKAKGRNQVRTAKDPVEDLAQGGLVGAEML